MSEEMKEVTKIEETPNEIGTSIEDTDTDIDLLRRNQYQNEFIASHKGNFISICNKILDFLLDIKDRQDIKEDEVITPLVLAAIDSLLESVELIKRKLSLDAPLSDEEVSTLLLACMYVSVDFQNKINDFTSAKQILDSFIQKLNMKI